VLSQLGRQKLPSVILLKVVIECYWHIIVKWTWRRASGWPAGVWFPRRKRELSPPSANIGCGDNLATYTVGTGAGGDFPRNNATWTPTSIHYRDQKQWSYTSTPSHASIAQCLN
jgi:hypothetical protein